MCMKWEWKNMNNMLQKKNMPGTSGICQVLSLKLASPYLGDFCIGVMQISGRALEGSKDIHGFLDEEVTLKNAGYQHFLHTMTI